MAGDPKLGPSRAAAVLKNQGNLAFKAGEFAKAAEHYTAAMKADPSDAILPCNRSMAHLKLKQWREAARDATRSLELQPVGNSKALFRRASARKGLGDFKAAIPDFEAALALDPSNNSVIAELDQLKKQPESATATMNTARPPVTAQAASTKPAASPKPPANDDYASALRAAITPESTQSNSGDLLREVSTTRKGELVGNLKPQASQSATTEVPLRDAGGGFANLKKARQDRQTGRAAAISAARTQRPVPPLATSTQSSQTNPSIQASGDPVEIHDFVEFERKWTSVRDADARWIILKALPFAKLDRIFGEHLEPEMLEQIVGTVANVSSDKVSSSDLKERLSLLGGLAGIPRFDLLSMFVDNATREDLRRLLAESAPNNQPEAGTIANAWSISL